MQAHRNSVFAWVAMVMSAATLDGVRASGSDVREKIERTLVSVEFKKTPMEEAVMEVGRQAGVNVVVDWPALREAKIAGDVAILMRLNDVTAMEALEAVLRMARRGDETLEWWIDRDVVNVTTRSAAMRQPLTIVYSCRSLLPANLNSREQLEVERAVTALWRSHFAVFAPPWRGLPHRMGGRELTAPYVGSRREATALLDDLYRRLTIKRMEQIAESIREAISPESWRERGGMVGSVQIVGESLVITQVPSSHRRIESMLSSLSIKPSTR